MFYMYSYICNNTDYEPVLTRPHAGKAKRDDLGADAGGTYTVERGGRMRRVWPKANLIIIILPVTVTLTYEL